MASLASELVHSSRDTHDMDTSHRNTIASDGGNRASEFSDRTEISMSTDRNRRKVGTKSSNIILPERPQKLYDKFVFTRVF
jgi:hypothetical protein